MEFSGGPVIAFLVSAAPHVKTIVFSAYTEQERREVSQWKHGMKGAYDWSAYFEYVVQHLEGQARSCQEERKRILRQKISKIIECDITKNHPIDASISDKFDIIHASACLDAVCKTLDEFKQALRKLTMLLKPSGFLLSYVEEKATYYRIGDSEKWYSLCLSFLDIVHAFQEAGLETMKIDRDLANGTEDEDAAEAYIFIAGKKR